MSDSNDIIRLPRNFTTYFPREYEGAVCEQCGRPLEVVHDYRESDWPYRFRCTPCDNREAAEYRAHREPIERFEHDGMMLRWWMENNRNPTGSWLRLLALTMQYIGTPQEYAIYESRWKT